MSVTTAGLRPRRIVGFAAGPDADAGPDATLGPDAALGPDIVLGPDHPTLDGLPQLAVAATGGRVTAAEWLAGTVHRGAEKLFESRDYRQIIMLVDRHDWLSAFCSEIGVVVGVERALGLTTPPRAQHLRILLCELTRIAHHLAFLAPLPGPLPERWREGAWAWREEILGLLEGATGHRVHPMFCQVGGVRADVPDQWVQAVAAAAASWPTGPLPSLDGPELAGLLDARYAGVAPLTRRQALGFGASGPVGRASGVDLDLRRDDPYLPYPPFEVPLATEGDARARVRMLVAELGAQHRPRGLGRRAGGCGSRPAGVGPPAQGRARARGPALHLDREPDGHQRLPARLAQRPHALASGPAHGRVRACRGTGHGPGGHGRGGPAGRGRQLPARVRGRRPMSHRRVRVLAAIMVLFDLLVLLPSALAALS